MEGFKQKLAAAGFKGEVDDSIETLDFYSHDASMFEVRPQLVVCPKDSDDIQKLVMLAAANKTKMPELSLTARSAGTDMSGGAINDSIIVDFNKHLTRIGKITKSTANVQPGALYRDFDEATKKQAVFMPTYPASRDLASVGGMVNNNAGGEKSIEFGKTIDFVNELQFVFSDGVERTVKPLTKAELDKKMAQKDFEGQVYKKLFDLIDNNYEEIKNAKPKVSKNSTGYNLWDVWNRETGIFDLTKLIVGAQGTLGFVTDITFRVIHARSDNGVLVIYLRDIRKLGEIIPKVLESKPSRFESFDDKTLWLAIRFMPSFLKILGPRKFIFLLVSLLPDALQLLKGFPKLVLMVSFKGDNEQEVRDKIRNLHIKLQKYKTDYEINGFQEAPTDLQSERFWIIRRYSFQLLRSKVRDKHTAPFIDDFVVPPEHLVEFLPKLRKIIKKYKLFATVAGHMGDGNFHVIPLMKLEDPKDRAKILPVMKEVNNLVLRYHGSLSGEHNDGLVRGPWLEQQYGREVVGLFREIKHIFDPEGIFNPHKKATADWNYSFSHIREHF